MESDVDLKPALIGKILQGTYRIERRIGRGSMGSVYEVSHLRLARRFAAKVLLPSVTELPDALARFQKEAEVTSALGHPHILEMIDFNQTDDGMPYIIMEMLDGEELGERISRVGRLEVEEAASIFCETASALQAAHDSGVVHRDLKPSNIYLCNWGSRDDFVKVLDFGLSKVLGSGMTKVPGLMGTPAYMAPEQAQQIEVDLRADVYSLGVILFEALSGRLPFTSDRLTDLLQKIVYDDPPSLLELCPDLPPSLGPVVARALRKDREERYASMAELMGAFTAVMQHAGFDLPDPTGSRTSSPRIKVPKDIARLEQSSAPPETTGGQTLPRSLDEPPDPPGEGRASTLSGTVGEAWPVVDPPERPRRRANWAVVVVVLVVAAVSGVFTYQYVNDRQRTPTRVAAVSPAPRGGADSRSVRPLPAPAAVSPDAAVRLDLAHGAASMDSSHRDSGAPVASEPTRPPRRTRHRRARTVLKVSTLFNGETVVARVLLDGRELGESPIFKRNVRPGVHVLTVVAAGFRKIERRVVIKRGKKNSVVVGLRR